MRKPLKILIGIITIWPLLYMLFFFGFFIYMFFSMWNGAEPNENMFLLIFPIHILTMLIVMGLLTFYIINAFRSERINKDMKVIWIVVLFMGNIIAMPIYWYLYIWQEPKSLVIKN